MCDLDENVVEFDPSKSDASFSEEVEFICFDNEETEYVIGSQLNEADRENYEYVIEGKWSR